MKDKIDLFSQLSAYHENILKLSQIFKPVIQYIEASDIEKAKNEFSRIYIAQFIEHFNFEEKIIFPAIKAWSKDIIYRELINRYLQEHIDMRNKGNEIILKLSTANSQFSTEQIQTVINEYEMLLKTVTDHAIDENARIIPLLKNNLQLRFLSNRNMVIYKTFLHDFRSGKSGVKSIRKADK